MGERHPTSSAPQSRAEAGRGGATPDILCASVTGGGGAWGSATRHPLRLTSRAEMGRGAATPRPTASMSSCHRWRRGVGERHPGPRPSLRMLLPAVDLPWAPLSSQEDRQEGCLPSEPPPTTHTDILHINLNSREPGSRKTTENLEAFWWWGHPVRSTPTQDLGKPASSVWAQKAAWFQLSMVRTRLRAPHRGDEFSPESQ